MFTPKLTSSRPKHNANDVGTGDRRSSVLFTPKTKSYTPLTGRTTRLNATELGSRSVLENATEHMLIDYGLPVPVLVTESLASKKSSANAKLDRNGWAWFVSDSKVVIWNYKQMPHIKAGQCFELSLSSCRLAHTASLVAVFTARPNAAPGCIAVSPDGVVRYWANVTLGASYSELGIADVRDDVCRELVILQTGCCIVATSSGALFSMTVSSSQNRLVCRPIRPAKGLFSGLGRRVSSLLFTQAPTQSSPLRRVLPGEMIGTDTQAVYVLTANYLQKWAVKSDSDKQLYQIDVGELFADCLVERVWKLNKDNLPHVQTWLLDMQIIRDGVVIFGAGTNSAVSTEVRYAFGSLHTALDEEPDCFTQFNPISHLTVYEEIEGWMPSYKMLMPSPSSSFIYLYDSSCICCVSASHPELTPETVEFPNLGCGSSDDLPLFISKDGELVSVKETSDDMSTTNFINKTASFQYLDTSLAANISVERIEELSQSGSDLSRLKAAFLASIQDPMSQYRAQSIVDDLFPPGVPSAVDPGSSLDSLVADLSREMIDDYPASDPRWAESLPTGVAPSSVSLILIHQLEDKLKAHELYLHFLKTLNIWSRLTTARARDDAVMATNMLLCEHAEKLEAAKVLHDFHTEYAVLVGDAIDRVLAQRRSDMIRDRSLTSTDLFYREVSRVQEVLDCLLACEEEFLAVEVTTSEVFGRIVIVNAIIIGLLSAGIKYRQVAASAYQVSNAAPSYLSHEFVPWTASAAIRSVIFKQHEIAVQYCAPSVQSAHDKGILFQQLVQLTDILLDGYRVQLDSIKSDHQKHSVVGSSDTERYKELLRKYEQERMALITPFMKHGEYEKAASLAEKYCDFGTLVELCEHLNNQERLHRYMDQFQNKGFSDFVFKWYMEAGKRGKLMASDLSSHPLLSKFLDTKENQFMSWLHDIQYGDYYQAHKTLVTLAEDERDYAAKKKTLLSLGKLTALACEDIPDDVHTNIQAIDDEQDLMLHQEQLPAELVETFGMDSKAMPVLSARKLIEMHISEYNVLSAECDFKKALDLLYYFAKEPDRDDLVLEIWCRAILKDEWKHISTVDPAESYRDSVFYRTLELLVSMAEDSTIDDLLPTADGLFDCDLLGDLRYREDFKYLIKAALEHIQRIAVASASTVDMN